MTRASDEVGTNNPDGRSVSVRGLVAGDERGLREMFRGLSPQTIHQRFHLPYPRVPETLAVHLARHAGGRSVVAVAEGGIVGHAMYAGEVRNEAEVAVVVADRWQNRGVGKRLLAELGRRAASRGIEFFTGVALGENRRVLGLVDAVFDGARHTAGGGSYEILMPLKGLRPLDPGQNARPRKPSAERRHRRDADRAGRRGPTRQTTPLGERSKDDPSNGRGFSR